MWHSYRFASGGDGDDECKWQKACSKESELCRAKRSAEGCRGGGEEKQCAAAKQREKRVGREGASYESFVPRIGHAPIVGRAMARVDYLRGQGSCF